MDWRKVQFDWNQARAFLVTAEQGSLSAAARALGLSQPTLSRQVAGLEEALGAVLFERVGRGFELTPTGKSLLEHARAMNDAALQLAVQASGQSKSLHGKVSISATEGTAVYQLPPILKRLHKQEPGIQIEIIATDEASDLKRREADIAVRLFKPSQTDLIVRRLRAYSYNLYATPEYLNSIGSPTEFAHLHTASFIGFDNPREYLKVLRAAGLPVTEKNFTFTTQNFAANWTLVKQGMGIGPMLEEVGDTDPEVVRALPNLRFEPADYWLVAHRELRTNLRVKRVFDFLAEALSEAPRAQLSEAASQV